MTYRHQSEREDCRRISSLISRLKIGLWWQSREDPRGFCLNPIWKNLKGKRPNVAHTFGRVDERFLREILDSMQEVCLQEVNSLEEICKYFWMPRGWWRSHWCFRERILTLSNTNLGGERVECGSPKNTCTWKVTVRKSVSNVWQTQGINVNPRQYQARNSYPGTPLTWLPNRDPTRESGQSWHMEEEGEKRMRWQ